MGNYVKSYDPRIEVPLDKIKIFVGTEAMNAGISSDHMKYCMYRGPPPNLYILFQTLGRVNRRMLALPGEHVFEIHLNHDLCFCSSQKTGITTGTSSSTTPAHGGHFLPCVPKEVLSFFCGISL